MKAAIRTTPVLLADNQRPRLWNITILMKGAEVNMTFTDKLQAQEEYEKSRQTGIYRGRWIESITLIDSYAD